MTDYINNILNNRKLRLSFIATIAIAVIAYTFKFTNAAYGWDNVGISLNKVSPSFSGAKWLGWSTPLLTMLQSIPWLDGVIGTFLMSVTVYILILIFDIETLAGIIATAAICQISPTIIMVNTYGYSLAFYLALLFSVLGAYFLVSSNNLSIKQMALAIICIAVSAGYYGAFLTTTFTVLFLKILMDIFYGKTFKDVSRTCTAFIGIPVIAVVIFYLILRILLAVSGQQLQSYGGENNISSLGSVISFLSVKRIADVYGACLYYYIYRSFTPHLLTVIIFVLFAVAIIVLLKRKVLVIRDSAQNVALAVVIILLMPVAMGFLGLFTTQIHELMYFGYSMPYLTVVVVCELLYKTYRSDDSNVKFIKSLEIVISCLLVAYIYFGIVLANTVAIRASSYMQSTYALCIRVVDRIECTEGFTGEEQVCVIYYPSEGDSYIDSTGLTSIPILDDLWNVSDSRENGLNDFNIPGFIRNIMGVPINVEQYTSLDSFYEDCDLSEGEKSQISDMDVFPNNSCVQKVGNRIVVILNWGIKELEQ